MPHFRKTIPFIEQKAMHIPNKAQILLISRRLTYGLPPFLDRLQDPMLDARRPYGRTLGEATHQLIEELLGAYLKLERVSAVLDTYIEELLGVSSIRSPSFICDG